MKLQISNVLAIAAVEEVPHLYWATVPDEIPGRTLKECSE